MPGKMRSLGLCLGASTVSIVELEADSVGNAETPRPGLSPKISNHWVHPHEGNPKRTLRNAFEQLDIDACDRIAATGRKFRKFVNLSAISEPEAVEHAYRFVKPRGVDCPAVVSASPAPAGSPT